MSSMVVTQLRVEEKKLLSGSPRALQNGRAAFTPGSMNEVVGFDLKKYELCFCDVFYLLGICIILTLMTF